LKLDIKIFTLFIITVLIYGGGYYFGNLGKFIFPVNYSHFVIGIISLYFFFTTKFSQFSILLLPFGLSLVYVLFPIGYQDVICGITSIVFTLFIFGFALRNKQSKFYVYFLIYVLVSFLAIGFIGMFGSYWDINYLKFIYGIKFIIFSLILRKEKELETLDIGIKRMILVLGMYYFVEMMSFY